MRELVLASALAVLCAAGVYAWGAPASDSWVRLVSPVITAEKKQRYSSLSGEQRAASEKDFWNTRSIASEEYFLRLAHADAVYGSGATLSGQNTDRGRVHLALGAPNRTTRLASSRTFVPIEIWQYDDPSLRLSFFARREGGEPQLYSPSLRTIRALLLPGGANRGLFPVNDVSHEQDARNRLPLSPAEASPESATVS
jgi:GWxTD domain-containing protein